MQTAETSLIGETSSALPLLEEEMEKEGHPFFLHGFCPNSLQHPGVFAVISMIPNSPFLGSSGCIQLVDFLANLPHPSIVVLTDALKRHSIMGMQRAAKRSGANEERALREALECGEPYVKAFNKAIGEKRDIAHTVKINLLRWQDVFDGRMFNQEAIARKHYEKNTFLRERVNEIALDFLYHRRPLCKSPSQRIPYFVNYLLCELPIVFFGFIHNGQHYSSLIYATTKETAAGLKAEPKSKSIWTLVDDIRNDPEFSELNEELLDSCDGLGSTNGLAVLSILRQDSQRQISPGADGAWILICKPVSKYENPNGSVG